MTFTAKRGRLLPALGRAMFIAVAASVSDVAPLKAQQAERDVCASSPALHSRVDLVYGFAVRWAVTPAIEFSHQACLNDVLSAIARSRAEAVGDARAILERLEGNLAGLAAVTGAARLGKRLDEAALRELYQSQQRADTEPDWPYTSLPSVTARRVLLEGFPAFRQLALAADSLEREMEDSRRILSVMLLNQEYAALREDLRRIADPPTPIRESAPIRTSLMMSNLRQNMFGVGMLIRPTGERAWYAHWRGGTQILGAVGSLGTRFGGEAMVGMSLLRWPEWGGPTLDVTPLVGRWCLGDPRGGADCGTTTSVLLVRYRTAHLGVGRVHGGGLPSTRALDIRVVYDF